MSRLLAAQQDPWIGWHSLWTKTNKHGEPIDRINDAFKQPDTIDVSFNDKGGSKRASNVKIVPDKGNLGPEYAYVYLFKQFDEKILNRIPVAKRDADFWIEMFSTFASCLQGTAAQKWDSVLKTHFPSDADKTEPNFEKAKGYYLEAIANQKYLGDCIIRWLRAARKPATMEIEYFEERRTFLVGMLKSPVIRKTLAEPTDQELADEFFLGQPKDHQLEYAKLHEDVETDNAKLVTYFQGCARALGHSS